MKKNNEELVAVEIIPDDRSLLQQLYSILTLETARLQAKQRDREVDLGTSGAKQINMLIKSARDISEEKRTQQKEDAVQQMTDEQRLEMLTHVIQELPEEQRKQLFQKLLTEHNGET